MELVVTGKSNRANTVIDPVGSWSKVWTLTEAIWVAKPRFAFNGILLSAVQQLGDIPMS